jgi:uncharacterized protein
VKIDRDPSAPGPIVHGFGPRGFRIEQGYYPALLLTPSSAYGWEPPAFEALDTAALESILTPKPEFLLLGTGARLRRAPPALAAASNALGLGIEVMDSRAAARAWGVLRGEGRPIAAALYPVDA